LHHGARSSPRRPHLARLEESAQSTRHVAQHDCATLRAKFFRLLENADYIWVFGAFDFCAIAESEASA
jgi:hypothetical protein